MDDRQVRTVAVVLNYNDANTCLQFLKETEDYKVIDKIIIVDNHSTDDSIEKLQKITNDRILLICSDANNGYAYGNNYGMKYAVKNYENLENIIITNPDIHVSECDIEKIIKPLSDGYGMSTGIIYNYNPDSQKKTMASNFGWRVPSYGDMISNCFLLTYKLKRSVLHTSMYLDWDKVKDDNIIHAEAVPGCFFALSSEAAKKIDYMDESTFLYGEETILAWRLKNAGYSACIVNYTKVLHENSVSINKTIKENKHKVELRLQSEITYLRKYLKCNSFLIKLYSFNYKLGRIEKELISIQRRISLYFNKANMGR